MVGEYNIADLLEKYSLKYGGMQDDYAGEQAKVLRNYRLNLEILDKKLIQLTNHVIEWAYPILLVLEYEKKIRI